MGKMFGVLKKVANERNEANKVNDFVTTVNILSCCLNQLLATYISGLYSVEKYIPGSTSEGYDILHSADMVYMLCANFTPFLGDKSTFVTRKFPQGKRCL